jgi:hypothetical protein
MDALITDPDLALVLLTVVLFLGLVALVLPRLTQAARSR